MKNTQRLLVTGLALIVTADAGLAAANETTSPQAAELRNLFADEWVARIRAEMDAIIAKLEFKGDFAAFLNFLRTDPRFYARTPEELLKAASYIAKQIDGMLPGYFGKLPRLPYSVQPVPAEIAPNYTGGRYVAPPIGGTRGRVLGQHLRARKAPLYVLTLPDAS